MRITVAALPCPNGQAQFEVGIPDPGVIRHVAFVMSQKPILVAGRPDFEEQLCMFVEITPDATRRNRRFVVMQNGQVLTAPEGSKPVYCGSALSPGTGLVVHIYELKAVS